LVKLNRKYFRPTLQWMVCMTLNCVGLTQSSVIQIIHRNVGLKCFLIYLHFCYYRYFLLRFIFHKVVWKRIYRMVGYIIITLLQIVYRVHQWKNFENRSIIGEGIDKVKCHILYGPRCRTLLVLFTIFILLHQFCICNFWFDRFLLFDFLVNCFS